MSEQNPTERASLKLPPPPKEGEAPPPPVCPGCKQPMPGLYLYLFQLAQPPPHPVVLFQAICCPRQECLTAITILPAGEVKSHIATPGAPGWPT